MEKYNELCNYPEWLKQVILVEAIVLNFILLALIGTLITLRIIIWRGKKDLLKSEQFKQFYKNSK